jgi:8-oxo-dGTP diphosphatase
MNMCEEALENPRPTSKGQKVVLVAAAALIDTDGRILLAQRPEGKAMAGLWESA